MDSTAIALVAAHEDDAEQLVALCHGFKLVAQEEFDNYYLLSV